MEEEAFHTSHFRRLAAPTSAQLGGEAPFHPTSAMASPLEYVDALLAPNAGPSHCGVRAAMSELRLQPSDTLDIFACKPRHSLPPAAALRARV